MPSARAVRIRCGPQVDVADPRGGIRQDQATHAIGRVNRGPERGQSADRHAAEVDSLGPGRIDDGDQILAEALEGILACRRV